jgi:hypothetical protein
VAVEKPGNAFLPDTNHRPMLTHPVGGCKAGPLMYMLFSHDDPD